MTEKTNTPLFSGPGTYYPPADPCWGGDERGLRAFSCGPAGSLRGAARFCTMSVGKLQCVFVVWKALVALQRGCVIFFGCFGNSEIKDL